MKKIIGSLLCLCMFVTLLAGCKPANAPDSGLKPAYSLSEEDAPDYFFMDREYVLTSADVNTTQKELDKAGSWLTEQILDSAVTGKSAFDFTVGGQTFSQALSTWTLTTEQTADTDIRTDYTLTYQKDSLTVTVYATLYKTYAILEWTVWIENTGVQDSEVITDFYGLNHRFSGADSDFKLTRFKGSLNQNDAFRATQEVLEDDHLVKLRGSTGKPSVENAPYFNLQWKDPDADWGIAGVLCSVGWPGQWAAEITKSGKETQILAKQESLRTYLEPGEKIRSPLMTLLFWEKDLMRSQNLWRRWLYNVAMPQPDGSPIPPQLSGNTSRITGLSRTATTENQLEAIRLWIDCDMDIDGWLMDAGWYEGASDTGWMNSVGGWVPDPDRFGDGMAAIGRELADAGMEFILWYEPERVANGSPWYYKFNNTDYLINIYHGAQIFNLANDAAADFLIEHITDSVQKNGVTLYRQDLCIDGSSGGIGLYWKSLDTENRTGITENRYLVNYLRYLDAVIAATGSEYMDICASGGRRMDLESIKRGVALWRCDTCYDPIATQCHSWGINFYMPYSGQGTRDEAESTMVYTFRSNLMPFMQLAWNINESLKVDSIGGRFKQRIAEHKNYAKFQTADYYPLTKFDQSETAWMAWQFNDPTTSEGIIQIFRRADCEETSMRFYLSGLDPDVTYHIENIDGGSLQKSGRDLMINGLSIKIETANTALILHYFPLSS